MTDSKQILEPVVVHESAVAASAFASFSDFYAIHHRPVFEALALTLRNDELARDAAAEGMARAFQKWADVGIYGNPAGWVYRVGLNWATSRLRKFRREVPSDRAPEAIDLSGPVVRPDLDAAIAALPVDQRAVVVLRYHLDWSESAAAEALGIAPGTVKSRLSRALDRLAVSLEERPGA